MNESKNTLFYFTQNVEFLSIISPDKFGDHRKLYSTLYVHSQRTDSGSKVLGSLSHKLGLF